MSVEQGLTQLIQKNAKVSSLINTTNGAGAYWILMPKGAAIPCVVLSRVATSDSYAFSGPIGARNALFQVDCYASSYYASKALSMAVRKALASFTGNLPDADATNVPAVFTTKDWDLPYEEGAKGFVYRSMLEFRVWYYE
jgi:hypothetical protein